MQDFWNRLREALKERINPIHFQTWFQHVTPSSLDQDILKIEVPNRFTRDWIEDNYLSLLMEEAKKIRSEISALEFVVRESALPVSVLPPSLPPPAVKPARTIALNDKYDFEHFVVGNSNQFAHAASLAVANNLAESYNPLFIYGGVGLGKTHLLNSIGLECVKKDSTRVLYVTGEQFTNEVIRGIRYDKMPELRQRYRNSCDLLLIDDIQFIAGKERTQEEFFHTFNALYESRKQIVLTSDQFPKDILQLEERLRSRFQWGLIADIQAPDLETRVAILKKKAFQEKIALPDDVALFLASRIQSNIRELEGALIRLGAFVSLTGAKISVDLAKEVLKNIVKDLESQITIERIQKTTSEFYDISINDLNGPRRMKRLAHPRQIAMYLSRKWTKSSFPEIGQKFGGKDHSTVVHAVQKIEANLSSNETLKKEVLTLEDQLRA